MACTLTVRIKDSEKSLKKDFLLYEQFTVDQDDTIIKGCIEETLAEFNGEPDDVFVTIKLEIV